MPKLRPHTSFCQIHCDSLRNMVIKDRAAEIRFLAVTTIFSSATCMHVPKMVKNGIYSLFVIGGGFIPHVCFTAAIGENPVLLAIRRHAKTSLSSNPIMERNRQKKNKSQSRRLREQARGLYFHSCRSFLRHSLIDVTTCCAETGCPQACR
jgi:hypothetical protein